MPDSHTTTPAFAIGGAGAPPPVGGYRPREKDADGYPTEPCDCQDLDRRTICGDCGGLLMVTSAAAPREDALASLRNAVEVAIEEGRYAQAPGGDPIWRVLQNLKVALICADIALTEAPEAPRPESMYGVFHRVASEIVGAAPPAGQEVREVDKYELNRAYLAWCDDPAKVMHLAGAFEGGYRAAASGRFRTAAPSAGGA